MDSMIQLGFGTWKISPDQATEVISTALSVGYRHIDTASAYINERGIGRGIAESGIPREQLYISGKLWNSSRSYDKAIRACEKSLKNLGITYFDQYLIHWPASPALYDNWKAINSEAWRAMETLHRQGLVRSIGVCNFKPFQLEALSETAELPVQVNQIECHPGWYPEENIRYCLSKNIRVEAWSPLGNSVVLGHETIKRIAVEQSKTPAQICLRWCIQHGVLPITKSVSEERMAVNLKVNDFHLQDEIMKQLNEMDVCGYSGLDPETVTQFG